MVVVGNTVETLVRTANSNIETVGGVTVEAYPDRYFSTPLAQTMFTLGIKKIEVGPRIQTTGANGTVTTTRNRQVVITFCLNVYSPHKMGGQECSKGFDRWLDMAIRLLQLNISTAGCDEVEYDQALGTNVLKGYFTVIRVTSETIPVS